MNHPKLYYTPPLDEQFNDLKEKAIALWSTMGDEPNYSKEKIDRISSLENVGDNFMYMVAMFDLDNQLTLSHLIKSNTRKSISERMIDGGQPDWANHFK